MKKKTIKKLGLTFGGLLALGTVGTIGSTLVTKNFEQVSKPMFASTRNNEYVEGSVVPATVQHTFSQSEISTLKNQSKIFSADAADVISKTEIRIYNASSYLSANSTATEINKASTFLTKNYNGTAFPWLGEDQWNYRFSLQNDQWSFVPGTSNSVDLDIKSDENHPSNDSTFGFKLYNNNDEILNKIVATNYSKEKVDVLSGSSSRVWDTNKIKLDSTLTSPINGVVKIQNRGLSQRYKGAQSSTNKAPYIIGQPSDYISIANLSGKTYNNLTEEVGSNFIGNVSTYNYGDASVTAFTGPLESVVHTNVATVSNLNVGLFNGKIYLGKNRSSISLVDKSQSSTFNVTPQEFVNNIKANPSLIFDYVTPTFTNTPDIILDNNVQLVLTNDISSRNVNVTFKTTKSFIPNLEVNNSTGDLVDSDWIKDQETVSETISIPYSKFSNTVDLTTCKTQINITELGITNLTSETYADDFLNATDSKQKLYDSIMNDPNKLFTNLPVSNQPLIENGVNGLTLAAGTTTEELKLTFNYLSNNGTTNGTDLPYVQNHTVTLMGFKNAVTTVNTTQDIKITPIDTYNAYEIAVAPYNVLTKYLRDELVIRKIFGNVSDYFVAQNAKNISIQNIHTIDGVNGSLVATLNVLGFGTTTGFNQTYQCDVTFVGFKSIGNTSFVNGGKLTTKNFPLSLTNSAYLVDLEEQALGLVSKMQGEMIATPNQYLENFVPNPSGENFRNLTLVGKSNDTATFNVEYWAFVNGTSNWVTTQFTVSGFSTNDTIFNTKVASSLTIPSTTSSNVSQDDINSLKESQPTQISGLSKQKEIILNILKDNYTNFFENIPESFSTKNSNLRMTNVVGNNQAGSLSFDVEWYVVASGQYTLRNYSFTMFGFKQLGNETSIRSSISIGDLEFAGFSANAYSIEFMKASANNASFLSNLQNSFINNASKILSNAPTQWQQNNRPLFVLKSFGYNSNDLSKVDVSLQYLASNGDANVLAEYKDAVFSISFNSKNSEVASQYSQNGTGLYIQGINIEEASNNPSNIVRQEIIRQVNSSLGIIFNNSVPTDSEITEFEVGQYNVTEGSMSISFTIKEAFNLSSYTSVTFSMKITGFKQGSNSTINFNSSIDISDLNNAAQNTNVNNSVLFNSLVNKYAYDAWTIISQNSTNYNGLLRDVVRSNPGIIVSNSTDVNFTEAQFISYGSNFIMARVNYTTSASSTPQTWDVKVIGFNVNATQSTRTNIISPKDLQQVLGGQDMSKLSVDQVANILQSTSGKEKLVESINYYSKDFFKVGTINDQLQSRVNSGNLITVNNIQIETTNVNTASRLQQGIKVSITNLPLTDSMGTIYTGSFVVLDTTKANNPNEQFIFGNSSSSQQASSTQDYTWVWILIGCLLGVALLIILAYIIYRLLKNRPYRTSAGNISDDSFNDDYDDGDDYDSYSDDYYDYF